MEARSCSSRVHHSSRLTRYGRRTGKRFCLAGLIPARTAQFTWSQPKEARRSNSLSARDYYVVFPQWTPDGKSIVFQKSQSKSSSNDQNDVEVLDIQTGKVSALPGSENLIAPALSPDGRFLAAATSDRLKLMLFDFAIQKWVELAKTDIGAVSWTRDGKYLYFDSGSGLDPAISRLRIADRKLERVTGLKDFRRVEFSFYPWSGLTPDGAPLLLRDIGTAGSLRARLRGALSATSFWVGDAQLFPNLVLLKGMSY